VTFDQLNLHPNVAKAIAACGYTKPTPIQSKAIPEILNGNDTVACAQTGSGKTAAFVLPALDLLNNTPSVKQTRILVLTPTRELANQITTAAKLYGKFSPRFNIVSLLGGMSYHNQIKDLQRGADIIVATPGRLLDHIENGRVNLSHIEMLILDEADRMLDMGFIEDVEYIAKLTPKKRQTLLFSATINKELSKVVRHLLNDPISIDLSQEKVSTPKIHQEFYKVNSPQHKLKLLKHLLNDTNIFKSIIFSATKINADRLANELRDHGYSAAALHGDLRQQARNRTIEQLRNGKVQFVVATDVAARGIDINDLTHVIQYDLPKFCEDYVHRIGRTGRAGKTGTAISFVLPSDMRHLQRIERYVGQKFKLTQPTDALTSKDKLEVVERDDTDSHDKKRRHHDRDDRAPRGKSFARKSEGGHKKSWKKPSERGDSARPRREFSSEKSDARGKRRGSSERFERKEYDSARPRREFSSEKSDARGKRRGSSERFERKEYDSARPRREFSSEKSDARGKHRGSSERFERKEYDGRKARGESSERGNYSQRRDHSTERNSDNRGNRRESTSERSGNKRREFASERRGENRSSARPVGKRRQATDRSESPTYWRQSSESSGHSQKQRKFGKDRKGRRGD
jgi:superfamily II DNA/RNA helicase